MMKRALVISALLFLPLFILAAMDVHYRPSPLHQKFRLDRFLANPSQALRKLLGPASCRLQPAFGAIQAHADSSIGSCDCDIANAAEAWNDCFSCLFMGTIGLYNQLADIFTQLIDPDVSVDTAFPYNGVTINLLAEESSVSGFDRYTHVTDTNDDICMALYYSKNEDDVSRIKGLLLLNIAVCGAIAGEGAVEHALALKFDIGYTDADVQTAQLMDTGNYDGGAFDVGGGGTDSILYMSVEVDDSGANTITTSHLYQLIANSAWKYFVTGQDDTSLLIKQKLAVALNDTEVTDGDMDPDPTGLETKCFDDSTNTDLLDLTTCDTAGYTFVDFPFTVNSISSSAYPTWNSRTTTVTANMDVEDFF